MKSMSNANPFVGARLAREEAVPFNIIVARHTAIAGKPAPTVVSGWI